MTFDTALVAGLSSRCHLPTTTRRITVMSYKDPYVDRYFVQPQPKEQRYIDSVSDSTGGTYVNPSDETHQSYDKAGTSQEYEPYDGYRDEPDPPHAALPLNDVDDSYPPPTPPKDRVLEHDFAATTAPRQER